MTIVYAGLIQGALFAIVASGYNLMIVGGGVLNFAMGAYLMFGTFLAYQCLAVWHLPIAVTILFAVAAGAAIGALSDIVAVWPITTLTVGRSFAHGELVTTVGVSTILAGAAGLIWGYDPLGVPFPGTTEAMTILGGRIYPQQIVLLGVAIVIAVALHLWSRRTRLGLAALCASEDRIAATARGLNARKLEILSFAVAGAFAGGSAVLIAPSTFAVTSLGNSLALSGFVAIALGGLANQLGGLIAAFTIGIAGALAGRYLGGPYLDVTVFAVLIVVLLLKPSGLGARISAQRTV